MIQEVVAGFFMLTGAFFLVVAAIGFVRLPDVFCRLHVNGVIDTLGAPLILFGIAVLGGATLVSLKLLLAIVFLVVSSPLVGHLLARAALEAGHEPGIIEEKSEHRWVQARTKLGKRKRPGRPGRPGPPEPPGQPGREAE